MAGRIDESAELLVCNRNAIDPERVNSHTMSWRFVRIVPIRSHTERAAGNADHVGLAGGLRDQTLLPSRRNSVKLRHCPVLPIGLTKPRTRLKSAFAATLIFRICRALVEGNWQYAGTVARTSFRYGDDDCGAGSTEEMAADTRSLRRDRPRPHLPYQRWQTHERRHQSDTPIHRCVQGRLRRGRHDARGQTAVACRPDVICWNGSKGGGSIGLDADRSLCERIAAATGKPATTSSLAILEAFATIGVHRFGLVTPYASGHAGRIPPHFLAQGYARVCQAHAGLSDNLLLRGHRL